MSVLLENDIDFIEANYPEPYTQAELAQMFAVSSITIRRALAERGKVTLAAYKTKEEMRMLTLLKSMGINDYYSLCDYVYQNRKP